MGIPELNEKDARKKQDIEKNSYDTLGFLKTECKRRKVSSTKKIQNHINFVLVLSSANRGGMMLLPANFLKQNCKLKWLQATNSKTQNYFDAETSKLFINDNVDPRYIKINFVELQQ